MIRTMPSTIFLSLLLICNSQSCGQEETKLPVKFELLISNQQVKDELELVDDQLDELSRIHDRFILQVNEATNNVRRQKWSVRKWAEAHQQLTTEREVSLRASLLPFQFKRLQQISTQIEMKNKGDLKAITELSLAKKLDIDEDQKKLLQRRHEEIYSELKTEIVKLKEKARQKFLQELKPDQRKRLAEILGQKFDQKTSKDERGK